MRIELLKVRAVRSWTPLEAPQAAPARLVLLGVFADAENLPISLAVHADRNKQRHVAHFADPAALEHDAVDIHVAMLALDRPIAPRLNRSNLLIDSDTVDDDTRLPHSASVTSSTRRTETPATYLSLIHI